MSMLEETSVGTIDVIKGIIAEQKLNAIKAQELGDDDDLRGGAAGLESLDCLNIILTLQERFGLEIENTRICVEVFRTPRTLADFVAATRPAAGDQHV